MNTPNEIEIDLMWHIAFGHVEDFWDRQRIETLANGIGALFDEFTGEHNKVGQAAYFVSDHKFVIVPDSPKFKDVPLKNRPIIDYAQVAWYDSNGGWCSIS